MSSFPTPSGFAAGGTMGRIANGNLAMLRQSESSTGYSFTQLDLGSIYEFGYAVVEDNAGRILLSGISDKDFVLARYDSSGSLDATFGSGGVVRGVSLGLGGFRSAAENLVVQSNDRTLAAVHVAPHDGSDGYFVRILGLASDGELDPSFGDGGYVDVRADLPLHWISGLAEDSLGNIILSAFAAPHSSPDYEYQVYLTRFDADGALDLAFGDDGERYSSLGLDNVTPRDMVIAPNDSIVILANGNFPPQNLVVARFQGGPACGDGETDPSEDCDDGNTDDGDCCSSTCTFEAAESPCLDDDLCNGDETCDGAGTCDAGTPIDCDDGNVCTADTCLAATGCESTPEPVATSCADSDLCNGDETCDGAGSCDSGAPLDCGDGDLCTQDSCDPTLGCQNAAEPATMCLDEWGKGSLLIKETVAGKEKLIAKLVKGPEILFSDFGDPTDSLGTDYQACLYDDARSYVGALDLDQAGLACGTKACWRGLGPRGFIYKDSAAAASGIKQLRLMAGADGKSMIKLIAGNKASKGQDQLPTGLSEGLVNASGATLQLFGTDAPECFSIDFTRVRKQESHVFSALK